MIYMITDEHWVAFIAGQMFQTERDGICHENLEGRRILVSCMQELTNPA